MNSITTILKRKDFISEALFIIAFCLLEFFLVNVNSPYSSLLAIIAIVFSAFWDKDVPIAIYICVSSLKISLSGIEDMMIMALIAFVAFRELKRNRSKNLGRYINVFILFSFFAIFSTIGGLSASFTALLFFLFNLLCVVFIAYMVLIRKHYLVFTALLFSGFFVMLQQTLHPLSFLEEGAMLNSKDVATSIAVPVFLLVWTVVNEKANVAVKGILLLLAVMGVITIVFTYSRGVLIALFMTIIYALLTGVKNKNYLMIAIAATIVVAYISVSDIAVDYDRMASNIEGGNGRTEIWENFYHKMSKEGVLRLFLGCGPGGLMKLTTESTYAHSAILDYFFSFGIIGFLFIIYVLSTIIKRLIKLKDRFYIGVFILNFFMFITHGNYVVPLFLFLLGICMGAACFNQDKTG